MGRGGKESNPAPPGDQPAACRGLSRLNTGWGLNTPGRICSARSMANVDGVSNGVLVVNAGTDDERPATMAEQQAAILQALEGQAVL